MSIKKKIILLGAAAYLYGRWERTQYKLQEVDIKLGLKHPLKIVHISDLHFDEAIKSRYLFFKKIADLQPDLIINTGDNLASKEGLETLKMEMKPLMNIKGAFVFGANDYNNRDCIKNPFGYFFSKPSFLENKNMPTDDVELFFIKHKWENLNNDAKEIKINDVNIRLEGLNDPHVKFDAYEKINQNPQKPVDLKLGLVHSPYKEALKALSHNDIIFAGHTHGGQIRIPKKGALVSNSDLEPEFAAGCFKLKDIIGGHSKAMVNVSQGLGTAKYFKFRINCFPIATVLNIT